MEWLKSWSNSPLARQVAGADHAKKHPGDEESTRDPERQGEHLGIDAGREERPGEVHRVSRQ